MIERKIKCCALLLSILLMCLAVLFHNGDNNLIVNATEVEDRIDNFTSAKLLTNSYGIIGSLTSVSALGSYGIDINPSSGKGQLTFYDFVSKSVSLFPHDKSQEQQGVIESVVGGAVPVSTEGGLCVVRLGYPFDKLTPPTIYFFGDDGIEQSRFVLPEQYYISPSTCIAQYDGSLIFALSRYDCDTKDLIGTDIVKINLIEKVLSVIYSFEGKEQYTLAAAYDDEIIVEKTERIEEDQGTNTYKTAYILSLSEATVTFMSDKWNIKEYSRAYKDSDVYYVSKNDENIIRYTLKEDIKQIIGSVADFGVNPQIVGIYDDNLLIRVDNDEGYGLYFEIDTGEIHKLTLPVGIIGETERDFFVATGEKTVNYLQEIDGKLVEAKMGVVEYALISKDDYWANKPNYQPFVDTIHVPGMIYRDN